MADVSPTQSQQPMVEEADAQQAQLQQQQLIAQQQEVEPNDVVYKGSKVDASKLKDRKYKGEDYEIDLALQHGAVRRRKCTDLLCCILFICFFVAMVAVSIWGFIEGNLEVSLAPVNGLGGFCGHEYPKNDDAYDNKNYDYLFIYDLQAAYTAADTGGNFWAYGVCVESCPTAIKTNVACSEQVWKISRDECSSNLYGYPTTESLGYCVPDTNFMSSEQQAQWTSFVKENKSSYNTKFVLDVYREKWVILMAIGFTVIYTLIYIKFMDACAICISWFSIIIIQASLVLLGVGVFFWGRDIENTNGTTHAPWLNFLASVFWITASFFCLCILCNLNSLKISFAIIETAGEYFTQTKRIIVVPFLFFILGTVFFLVWLFGLMCIATTGQVEPMPYYGDEPEYMGTYLQRVTIVHNTATANGWYIFYMFVGLIWVSAFLISCNDFVIMVSTITWYFSRKTDHGEEGHSNVWEGFHWIYRYNGGTLAFGSLVLSVVWVIRGFFEWLGEKLHEKTGENCCVRCCLACCMCCLDCTDRFIRYLTENAYIYCALSGDSFCPSALHSFMLMLKNSAKFAFVASVSNMFMYLAKISVSFLVVLTCWAIINAMKNGITELDEAFGPLFVIFLVSYIISAIFISVFHTSANTILQCFLVDRECAKKMGHVDAQHVPHTLLKFIEEYCKEEHLEVEGLPPSDKGEVAQTYEAPNADATLAEDSAAQKETF